MNNHVTITDKYGKKHKCDIEKLMIAPQNYEENWAWYLGKKNVETIILSTTERTRLIKLNKKYWKEMDK